MGFVFDTFEIYETVIPFYPQKNTKQSSATIKSHVEFGMSGMNSNFTKN